MSYSLEEEEKMLSMFESIANQPIEQPLPYNEVRVAKPIVESKTMFEGKMVDLNAWTAGSGSQKAQVEASGVVADSKKVGKAKTASNPDLSKGSKAAKGTTVATKGTKDQVTENDVVTEKKEDKQVTKLVTDDASHEAKGEPKAKTGSFDSAAKSAASAQRSKADSNKKFSEESKRQRKIDMFRDFVKSLGVDEKSKADAEKVLKKFDSISKYIGKAKMEGVMMENFTWTGDVPEEVTPVEDSAPEGEIKTLAEWYQRCADHPGGSLMFMRPWSLGGYGRPIEEERKMIQAAKAKVDAGEPLDKFEQYIYDRASLEGLLESAGSVRGKPMYEGFGDLINKAKKGIKHMTGGVKGYADPGDPTTTSSVEELATTIINDCSAAVWTLYYLFEHMSKLTAEDIDDDNMGTRKLPKTAAENLEGLKKIAPNGETYEEMCGLLRHGKNDKVKAYVDNLHENVVGYAKRLKEMLALATDIHASDMADDIDLWVQGKKCKLFNPENDSTMQKIYDAVRKHLKPSKDGNEDYTYKHPERACTIFTEINDFVKAVATAEEL